MSHELFKSISLCSLEELNNFRQEKTKVLKTITNEIKNITNTSDLKMINELLKNVENMNMKRFKYFTDNWIPPPTDC